MLDYISLVSYYKETRGGDFQIASARIVLCLVRYVLSHDHLAALVSEGIHIYSGRDACGVD